MKHYIIGIDEVGRGALAGPVVVAAAMLPKNINLGKAKLGRLKDSKKLTREKREAWASYFLNMPHFAFAIACVYPRQIEKKNISRAANLAAGRAVARLKRRFAFTKEAKIFLDGGLFIGNSMGRVGVAALNGARGSGGSAAAAVRNASVKTIIKADEKINAVKVASIIAKVHRDRLMVRVSAKYPEYGFGEHKGYGTRVHLLALGKYGPCAIHRLTFIDNFNIMNAWEEYQSSITPKERRGAGVRILR